MGLRNPYLQYRDEDGDLIDVSSNDDLQAAYDCAVEVNKWIVKDAPISNNNNYKKNNNQKNFNQPSPKRDNQSNKSNNKNNKNTKNDNNQTNQRNNKPQKDKVSKFWHHKI